MKVNKKKTPPQQPFQEELKEAKELFEAIFKNTLSAIIITDENEVVVAWNPFTETMLKMTPADLFNKPLAQLYPPYQWNKLETIRTDKKDTLINEETSIYKKDGSLVHVLLSFSAMKEKTGRITGKLIVMHDITERKRFEEDLFRAKTLAEQLNQAKSLFLANMSHEVRTPLNAILGLLDLTLETTLTDEQKENLTVAQDSARSLLNLLSDILDFSRIEAGKMVFHKTDFDLHRLMESLRRALDVIALQKDLQLILKIEPNVPSFLKGDPMRLRQVLTNLIGNAIKFTPRGKIVVSLRLQSQDEGKIVLLFSVQDEGIGIPKDRQKQIFEIFTQADDSTTRQFGGTGLGLAIAKHLVEMMNGHIDVKSEEGMGSAFTFTAQFEESLDPAIEHRDRGAELIHNDDLKGLRILLAEDNIVNQKMMIKMLEKEDCQVTIADNGQDVLRQMEQGFFDVILMDVHMPVLDGIEAAKRIRQNEITTQEHVPIVALTAAAMSEDKDHCLNAGMDAYLSKPLDRKALFETIKDLVRKEKHL